jgi:hypothetical protein
VLLALLLRISTGDATPPPQGSQDETTFGAIR